MRAHINRVAHMTFELWSLLAAILIGLIHLSAQSFSFKAQAGNAYTVGPRDAGLQPTGMAGRLERAHVNFLETFGYFAAASVIVHVSGSAGALSFWGAILYLTGRTLFLPLYAAGVPWLRTFSWNAATLGLALVALQPVWPG
jgi:uncharacterized MAPEG superfamily protein